MKWQIEFSHSADKFIAKNHIEKIELSPIIGNGIYKIQGNTNVNVNLKKMQGEWDGFYRIRWGRIRIIFKVDNEKQIAYIDRIDYRGDVYK